MKRRPKVYPDEFKFKVAREYMETETSQEHLMKKFDISGKGCITNWVRKFGLMPEPAEKRKNGYRPYTMKKGKEKTAEERALEKKVKELEKQLEHEKLRSEALDTMIRIAEDKFKIAIRKKFGTRQ